MYKFLDHTADIMFEVRAKTVEELLHDAAMAVFETTAKLETITPKIKKIIKLENKEISKLLYDFLEEIVFLKDKDYIVFSKVEVKITGNYKLNAVLYGENIDQTKHELGDDIKAVTLHEYSVKKENNEWVATVIVDI